MTAQHEYRLVRVAPRIHDAEREAIRPKFIN